MRDVTQCTCRISKTPCTYAFVYDTKGNVVAEVPMAVTALLVDGLTTRCAGAALQLFNRNHAEELAAYNDYYDAFDHCQNRRPLEFNAWRLANSK